MTPYKFLNHFKLCEGTVELEALNQCERTPENTDGILADFEHDQNRLKVKFGYITPSPTAKGLFLAYAIMIITVDVVVEGYKSACVHVNVPYNSVRRIIVDWDHMNETEIHGAKLYLHLNFPVEIKQLKKKDNKFQKAERYLTWDQQNAPPKAISDCPVLMLCFKTISRVMLYNVLSRMRSRCNLILEFCNVTIENSLPYLPAPMADDNLKKFIEKGGNYGLAYLIEALSSRGSIVNDHFLTSKQRRNVFISKIMTHFKKDANVTLETLERLLNTLDEHLEIRDLFGVYATIHQKVTEESQILKEEIETQKKNGFQRVRKVVITPTRKLLVVPELLMGNRFLRTHDESGEHTLRVQFRDDDSQPMRGIKCGAFLIERTVGEALRNGIIVAGRLYKYMGSSNSQMRDNGCYFFNAEASSNIHETIRKQFGKFDTNNIPKFMSRFGQCFTQARRSGVALERSMYNRIPDIIGGDDLKGEPYTYSDGVGNVSAWYAKNLAADFNIDEGCVPSVFQVRFRGMKGIVCVNPYMDIVKEFHERYQLEDDKYWPKNVEISFRPSQEKFRAPRDSRIEIVKYSAPTPCNLNRPLINIMDQVTSNQNAATHSRMCARVHELLDIQIEALGQTLNEEHKSRARLAELPRRIDFNYLSAEKGFILTEEPFFKSLLQCCVKYTLRRVRLKNQVQLPHPQARMAFGVIDETGLLQCGQIFFQATSYITKNPGPSAEKMILLGPVLMTKNPQIVAGDARMFDAVDIPELHHLVDVVVFPKYGPRPHPDEMAGSDLDGDEYTILWDPEFFFDRNEEPLDFPKPVVKTSPDDDRDVNTKMIDFYISYIEQDSIGTIANSFLVTSDLYGIDSEVSISIARKHSLAVDFPKTGKPPEKLTRRPKNGMPPEQPDRFPDFMERSTSPAYVSSSLNGQLYRRAKDMDSVLSQTMDRQQASAIVLDPEMEVEGAEKFYEAAVAMHNAYNASIEALLDNYGIVDEAEAFTGAIIKCRNRISDKDADDMSMFNTNFVVEQRINRTFQQFRRKFFEEFGGIENCTVDETGRSNPNVPLEAQENELNRRYCKDPTPEMKQKASACYKVCYHYATKAERRFLSFAWIVWDVLAEVKRENHFKNKRVKEQRLMGIPIHTRLHAYIRKYTGDISNKVALEEFKKQIAKEERHIAKYVEAHEGLDELCFILLHWGEQHALFNHEFQPRHLFTLLLIHGLDMFPKKRSDAASEWLEKLDLDATIANRGDIRSRIGGFGAVLMEFFKYLGGRIFKQYRFISFEEVGSDEFLLDSKVAPLSRAAGRTYYQISFSGVFAALPQLESEIIPQGYEASEEGKRLYEIDPFTIELPSAKNVQMQDILRNITDLTNVQHLAMRKLKEDYRGK
ncbi:hypothetical protein L596_023937 [Steinernema carpocapsae]|uniref:RNA-dependent RNA polymerase n=1 Tax=Steinernema carpocapsae TaxID=34508 RepID=A0A4U5MF60_STECR|nr:hypothetical protein L596_023937 [Steinernema carpocapsae]